MTGLDCIARMKSKSAPAPRLLPSMCVLCGGGIAPGTGEVDLLAVIGETGSVREAAERMGMSYMRAWTLVKTMNACFREPLVVTLGAGKSAAERCSRRRDERRLSS